LVGASPLNDLVRIEQAEVLPKLYGEGVVPQAVVAISFPLV
jgi:hypothetical protein